MGWYDTSVKPTKDFSKALLAYAGQIRQSNQNKRNNATSRANSESSNATSRANSESSNATSRANSKRVNDRLIGDSIISHKRKTAQMPSNFFTGKGGEYFPALRKDMSDSVYRVYGKKAPKSAIVNKKVTPPIKKETTLVDVKNIVSTTKKTSHKPTISSNKKASEMFSSKPTNPSSLDGAISRTFMKENNNKKQKDISASIDNYLKSIKK